VHYAAAVRDAERWRPSKYEIDPGRGLRPSRAGVGRSSGLIADRVAAFYGAAIPIRARGSLLDLGCGSAPLFGYYREYVTETTCIDWSSSLHPNPHLDLVHDLNDPLPVASASYDTVILSDVLEHVRQPAQVMAEIGRVLRPGGTLLMNVPFLYWIHEAPHDYYRYTRFALEYLAGSAGLEVDELEPIGGLPEVAADLSAKAVARVPRAGAMLAALVYHVSTLVLQTRIGRRVSQVTSPRFPLGYTMVATKPGGARGAVSGSG
jgi:SAM-dependent methyltransferase